MKKNSSKTLLQTIRSDKEFSQLAGFVSSQVSVVDLTETNQKVREMVKDFSDPNKFVAMLYLATTVGLAYSPKLKLGIRPSGQTYVLTGDEKAASLLNSLPEMKKVLAEMFQAGRRLTYDQFYKITEGRHCGAGFGYFKDGYDQPEYWRVEVYPNTVFQERLLEDGRLHRIGDWHQPGAYHSIAESFAVEHRFRSWDGETAITDPYSGEWDLDWENIVQQYLTSRGVADEPESRPKTDATEDEDVVNGSFIHGYFVQISDEIWVEGDDLIESPANPNFFQTQHDTRLWDLGHNRVVMFRRPVKYYSSVLKVVKAGNVLINMVFEPYMIYEDFVGGKTTHNKQNKIVQVVTVEGNENCLKIRYLDGNQKEKEVKF